jgi:hypothetical protein
VFIRGAWGELADRRPGMMTLISLGIVVAFAASLTATFGLFEIDVIQPVAREHDVISVATSHQTWLRTDIDLVSPFVDWLMGSIADRRLFRNRHLMSNSRFARL